MSHLNEDCYVTNFKPLLALAALAGALLVAPGSGAASDTDNPVTTANTNPTGARADWPMWQYGTSGSRFNAAERQIRPDNANRLELDWAWALPNSDEMHSQPAVVDDTVYFGGQDGWFYALDASSGQQRWKFDSRTVAGPTPPRPPNPDDLWDIDHNPLRNGPTVVGDAAYFGDTRGNIYALDRYTGTLRWSTKIHDHPFAVVTSSPLYYKGNLYVGTSGNEPIRTLDRDFWCCTFRGKVVALDARTGNIEWTYYTVPPATRQGEWPGTDTPRFGPSGVGVWSSPAIDPRTRTLFFGTGNNYSGSAGDVDALVALDIDTGRKRWAHRFTFPDTWVLACEMDPPGPACPDGPHPDTDVGASPNLFQVDGRTLVGVGQKKPDGSYWALNARTGDVVWEAALHAPIRWGSAYDGKRIYVGTDRVQDRPNGSLFALDPATGRVLWEEPVPPDGCSTNVEQDVAQDDNCRPFISAAATATRGLVFAGSYDGKLRVYAADDGDVLWTYDTMREFQTADDVVGRGGSVAGGGGAVVANGRLFVNSGYSFDGGASGNVLLAFGLQ